MLFVIFCDPLCKMYLEFVPCAPVLHVFLLDSWEEKKKEMFLRVLRLSARGQGEVLSRTQHYVTLNRSHYATAEVKLLAPSRLVSINVSTL